MIRVGTSVRIERPVDEVFAYFSEPERLDAEVELTRAAALVKPTRTARSDESRGRHLRHAEGRSREAFRLGPDPSSELG
jgi:hypothetical protein